MDPVRNNCIDEVVSILADSEGIKNYTEEIAAGTVKGDNYVGNITSITIRGENEQGKNYDLLKTGFLRLSVKIKRFYLTSIVI